MLTLIFSILRMLFLAIRRLIIIRKNLILENLFLRQQVIILKRKNPQPPILADDRAILGFIAQKLDHWVEALIVIKPETLIRWHRQGFKAYWRFISRNNGKVNERRKEVRELIQLLAAENPS